MRDFAFFDVWLDLSLRWALVAARLLQQLLVEINYKIFFATDAKVFTLSHRLSPTADPCADFIYAVCLGVYLQLFASKAHRNDLL
jgi:hypothetical protein